MKIAFISDLHCKYNTQISYRYKTYDFMDCYTRIDDSFEIEKPDIVIDAGDYEEEYELKDKNCPLIRVPGNHDFYGKTVNDVMDGVLWMPSYQEIDGLRIVSATLWTNFNNGNPIDMWEAEKGMVDYQAISFLKPENILRTFNEHLEFIQDNPADIIVTHHAPSYGSIHPRYLNNPLNSAFVSNLDSLILDMKPKYWLHGHVHDSFDYKIGETRILCNPLGYVHENRWQNYKPVYFEI